MRLFVDYNSAIKYVNSFINFEHIPKYNYTSSFKLERMYEFLKELDNPQKELRIIHVAGSKGKGSTCAITAYILREAGYNVGLYTSPHLVDFRERIRILDNLSRSDLAAPASDPFEGMIPEDEFIHLIEKIMPSAEKFRDHDYLGRCSFFEVLTACAFLYFKEKNVDYVVLETGLGGRLDATNVMAGLVCGITGISMEHTDKLGNTLDSIASEKAGIIKEHGIVVSARQRKEARGIIKKVCSGKKAKLYEIGTHIKYYILDSSEHGQHFNLNGPDYSYKNLQLNLIGRHQVENAAISIGMLKLINKDIKEFAIRRGLENAIWPGRMHIIRKEPYLILDGAQNVASMKALMLSINNLFKYKKLIVIFGISSDKDIKGVSSILNKSSDIIILTKALNNPRAENPVYLKNIFLSPRSCIKTSNDIDEALKKAFNVAGKEDLILVTGSLFIIGDILKSLSLCGPLNG